ncbi:MAG: hypothetical protein ACRC7R_07795 [Sarcina sp.]
MREYFIQKNENGQLIICKILAKFNKEDKMKAYDNLINLKTGHMNEDELENFFIHS